MTLLYIYPLISWTVTPLLCVWALVKLHRLEESFSALKAEVDSLDDDVDELWDAVFPDDDPDDEEDVEDDEPSNVIAISKRKVA